ncbi:hypothetical protein IWQ60_001537 [Tieghemiomyces parasiticus]|uniref:SEC7 domain-containing protein n=1 Tax=Tieghemiomyces parasiticus TaxID=78921 RepID=A0A9W8E1V2_9FUNG|nr:hypothetical protein IWQ60_001537 [Tieghemiomyces parasiticus]
MEQPRRPGRHSLGLGGIGRTFRPPRHSLQPQGTGGTTPLYTPTSALSPVPNLPVANLPTPHAPRLPAPVAAVAAEGERTIGNMRLLGVRHVSMPIPTTVTLNTAPPADIPTPTTSAAATAPATVPPATLAAPTPAETQSASPRRRFRSLTPRSIPSLSEITKKLTSLSPEKRGADSAARRRSHGTEGVAGNGSLATNPYPNFRVIHTPAEDPEQLASARILLTGSTASATLTTPSSVADSLRSMEDSDRDIAASPTPAAAGMMTSAAGTWRAAPNMASLPREIIYRVFRYVDAPRDLIACSQVCITWRFPALHAYRHLLRVYPYANMSLLRALRKRLRQHHTPVNMVRLDEIVYGLAEEYCQSNPDFLILSSSKEATDTIYSMLWTFLFIDREFRNDSVRNKMSCQYFIKLVQGSYKKQVYTPAALKAIYRDIRDRPILDNYLPIVTSHVNAHRGPDPVAAGFLLARAVPPVVAPAAEVRPIDPEARSSMSATTTTAATEVSPAGSLLAQPSPYLSAASSSARSPAPSASSHVSSVVAAPEARETDAATTTSVMALPIEVLDPQPAVDEEEAGVDGSLPIFDHLHQPLSLPPSGRPLSITSVGLREFEPSIFSNLDHLADLNLDLDLNITLDAVTHGADAGHSGSSSRHEDVAAPSQPSATVGGPHRTARASPSLASLRSWWSQMKGPARSAASTLR